MGILTLTKKGSSYTRRNGGSFKTYKPGEKGYAAAKHSYRAGAAQGRFIGPSQPHTVTVRTTNRLQHSRPMHFHHLVNDNSVLEAIKNKINALADEKAVMEECNQFLLTSNNDDLKSLVRKIAKQRILTLEFEAIDHKKPLLKSNTVSTFLNTARSFTFFSTHSKDIYDMIHDGMNIKNAHSNFLDESKKLSDEEKTFRQKL